MIVLTRQGAQVSRTQAVVRKVHNELNVTPHNPQCVFPRSFRMYTETPTGFVVPVHWALAAFPEASVTDERGSGVPAPNMAFVGHLRSDLRQPEAVEAVLQAWDVHNGGAMLCLPVGFGKTTCALYLACQLKTKTLILVHKEFLANQWAERIQQCVPRATVSRVQGPACDLSGDFVIAMMQTIMSRKHDAATFHQCGLVIADEVHHVGAEVFSRVVMGCHAPRTLGLTATPDRRDRLGHVVEWLVGPIAFRLQRQCQASTRVRVVEYAAPRFSQPPPLNKRGDIDFTSILTILAEDNERTQIIANEACSLARDGRHVLVLSHRRAHCKRIGELVRARGQACATYLGGDKTVPEEQVIVATYALTSEGFDCPRLTGLVLATPSSNVEQAAGRVMRGSADRSTVIVDVADRWGVCFAQHAKRRAFYKRCGFVVESSTETTVSDFAFMSC